MLSKEEIENNELYKTNYMQNPFEILLTEEKLDRLEKHCKRAIHFEKGNIREEHEIVLTLLYKYKKLESDKQKLIKKLEEDKRNADDNIKHMDDKNILQTIAKELAIGMRDYAQEILSIVKGEKNE